MDHLILRKISVSDIPQLQLISRQTFYETFADQNTKDDLIKYLEESFNSEKLKKEVTNPNSEFYFALLNDEPIGYLKLNFAEAQTELKTARSIEIERIYVLKAFHGKKVGQFLYDKAVDISKKRGADWIWLGVWEHNHKAINFYKKNGFTEFDKHIFKLGNDEQTDLLMRLKIN